MRAIVLVLILLTTACAHSFGPLQISDPSFREQLLVGQTSQQQVRQILGEPFIRANTSEGEISWTYMAKTIELGGAYWIPLVGMMVGEAEVKQDCLYTKFDQAGVLRSVSAIHFETKSTIMNQPRRSC